MSLVQVNGFESDLNFYARWTNWYEIQQWGQQRQLSLSTSSKRTGSWGMRFFRSNYIYTGSWSGPWASKLFYTDFSSNTMIMGFGIKWDVIYPEWGAFAQIYDSTSGNSLQLQLNGDRKLQISNQSGSLGSNAIGKYSLGTNTQYYIQMKAKFDGTNSYAIVKLGNQVDISVTDITTQTATRINAISFQNGSVATSTQWGWSSVNMDIDDIYVVIDDGVYPTDFVGVSGIYGALPNAIGDRNDFENYGGTDPVALVSESSYDTGTYIYGDGLNEKALFNFTDITPLTNANIIGVFVWDYAARSASGEGASKYRLVFRDSTDVEWESPDTTLADANQYQHIFKYIKNPITDSTQDATSINSMQYGIKVTQVD